MNTVFTAMSMSVSANGMIIIMDASLLLASIFVLSIALLVLLVLLADSCSGRRTA